MLSPFQDGLLQPPHVVVAGSGGDGGRGLQEKNQSGETPVSGSPHAIGRQSPRDRVGAGRQSPRDLGSPLRH